MHASMNSPMSFPYGNDHAKDVAMLTWALYTYVMTV